MSVFSYILNDVEWGPGNRARDRTWNCGKNNNDNNIIYLLYYCNNINANVPKVVFAYTFVFVFLFNLFIYVLIFFLCKRENIIRGKITRDSSTCMYIK